MKKHLLLIFATVAMTVWAGFSQAEMQNDHKGHNMDIPAPSAQAPDHTDHDMAKQNKKGHCCPPAKTSTDDSMHHGDDLRKIFMDGFELTYQLIDMRPKMATLKKMTPEMMAQMKSHHLMVFITEAEGKPMTDAKVGYLVTGPDNTDQKAMTMGMAGGFGADINMKDKGMYTIKTKMMMGKTKLIDEFTHEVK